MRLVVTGGGTGGHIYPAIEVAREMRRLMPTSAILYVGTKTGMESAIAPREGMDFRTVRSAGVMGKSLPVATKGLLQAMAGVRDAAGILRSYRPDVVLGTGGYASGPVVLSAYLLGIPGAIQEQNAVPGETNRLLARISRRTFAAWEYSCRFFPHKDRVVVTGNPIREELLSVTEEEARGYYGIPSKAPVILILGGSRGARTLAEAGLRMATQGLGDAFLIFVTGTEYYSDVVSRLGIQPGNGIDGARTGNVIIRPYEHKMAMAYRTAQLVVGRAGGMTLSEVTALGLPSIVIPSPNVAGNHQDHNARALEEKGAAVVVREGGDTPGKVADLALSMVRDSRRLLAMKEAALLLGKPHAARDICRELLALARAR